MARKLVTILIAAVATAIMLFAGGCGDDKPKAEDQTPQDILNAADNNGGEDFNARLDELKKTPMTVEIVQNGQSEGKWSQDGKGSWRYQSSDDDDEYFIYNAEENKFWSVSGNTAMESSGTEDSSAFEGNSPVLLMSAFVSMTYVPRTGGSDDVWEWEIPGSGKLSIEFKGPEGLVSKVTNEDFTTNDKDVTEFKYSDVGDLPASTFELPSGVTVESLDASGLGTLTGTGTTDDDGSNGGSSGGSGDDTFTNGGYSSGDSLYE